jgi:hypothetical protein
MSCSLWQFSKWFDCRWLVLTGIPLPPGVCLPKSAKAGVKSGPRGKIRGSRVLIGNLGWLICMKKQNSLKHKCSNTFSARKLRQTLKSSQLKWVSTSFWTSVSSTRCIAASTGLASALRNKNVFLIIWDRLGIKFLGQGKTQPIDCLQDG